MNPFVAFLEALGFDSPRQTSRKDIIELVVYETVKPVLKKLRSGSVKLVPLDKETTPSGLVHDFLAVQHRVAVGRIRVESYQTHSVIQLTNYQDQNA